MPLINCKIHLELNWTKNCVMSNIAGETTFKITNIKLYVPIVTLSTKDNANLTKQLNEGFKRLVFWNEYKTKMESKNLDDNNLRRFYLDASFQGVKRFFVLDFNNTTVDVVNNPINNPGSTQRHEDVPLWFYLCRDAADHNRTKIGRIRFLTCFGCAMPDMHLASGNLEKLP